MERVLPQTDLRQWVLTFPFAWRRRLAQDGALLSTLSRLFVDTVHSFYAKRAAVAGGVLACAAKSGGVTVVQRTSSDLRLNPHSHVVFLDGAYHEQDSQLAWRALGHLQTREVGQVLQRVVRRIDKHLRRRGLLEGFDPHRKLRCCTAWVYAHRAEQADHQREVLTRFSDRRVMLTTLRDVARSAGPAIRTTPSA